MAGRTIDLTDKIGLGGKPKVVIGDVELVVNDSAPTMLQIMKLVEGEPGPAELFQACDLLFDKPSRKALDALNLSFSDFAEVVSAAVELVAGEDGENPGNAQTPATT